MCHKKTTQNYYKIKAVFVLNYNLIILIFICTTENRTIVKDKIFCSYYEIYHIIPTVE